jgi:hypothetical protein
MPSGHVRKSRVNFIVALDEKYISEDEFSETYELAGRTRAAIRGFINYLRKYEAG